MRATGVMALVFMVAGLTAAQADERLWANCRTCHAVTAPDGTVKARGGRSGPNLHDLAGRAMAGDRSFRLYSDALLRLGAQGRRWTEGDFIAYLADPDQFLRAATNDPAAQSDMHVQMRQGGGALWAWLAALSR